MPSRISEWRQFLKTTELLAGASDDLLSQIGRRVAEVRRRAGETLFKEGESGDAAYLVVNGALSLEKDGVHLVSRQRGECVGEFSLIDDAPRSTSAIAETDVLLLRWEREDFREALSQSPEVAFGIFRVLLGKLRQDVAIQVQAGLERERWRQDLRRAHEIQMAMLPEGDFSGEQIEISGYCRPAADVGGDYYDYLFPEEDKLGMIIGDVTGHGFYAGLFVAMAKSCLHTQASIDYAPEKVMEAMNRTLLLSIQSGLLMTCCYLLIDLHHHTLAYCNAGHNFPYHYRRSEDRLERLISTDLLLGVPGFGASGFTRRERVWEKGDVLVLFSDGITEAADAGGEQFEEGRLEKVLTENRHESPARLKEAILQALSVHCKGVSQEDDVTLVVARAV